MRDDEWCAGLQPPFHLGYGAPPLCHAQKMQGQKAGRGVEPRKRRRVDRAFVQLHPRDKRSEGRFGELQHFGRRIDAVEKPARPGLGEDLEFQAASGPDNQHASILPGALGEEKHGHAIQISQTGHEASRPVCISRHGRRISEGIHPLASSATGRKRNLNAEELAT